MARIVVITPNPAIDITYFVDHQSIGETHRVREAIRRPGGKGLNVARVLAALGHDAISVLPLGGRPGGWMRESLAEAGIPAAISPIAGDTRSTVAIVAMAPSDSHPTLYSETGPTLSPAEVSQLREVVRSQLPGALFLVISGSLPPGLSADAVAEWIRDARAVGVPVLVDSSGDALLAAAKARADIVKPNERELLEATGTATLLEGVTALRELGAEMVVISRGADGMVGASEGTVHTVPAIPDISGNPTGAGDAATAGLVIGMIGGATLLDSLRQASALGATAVLNPVAGEIDPDTYRRLLDFYPSDGDRP